MNHKPEAYQVHEMFSSIQGEGRWAGTPATFIRLQGCTVGCWWCDAKRTWGPVLETDEYRVGYDLAERAGYNGLNSTLTQEQARGLVAGLFDKKAIAGIEYFTFFGSHEKHFLSEMLVLLLSAQDLHAFFYEPMQGIVIKNEQWQVFLDYFRPRRGYEVLGLEPRRSGQRMTVGEIVEWVWRQGNAHIVITGGEPTLWNLDLLISGLRSTVPGAFIELETSGQQALKGELRPDYITWSPKENLGYDAPHEFKMRVAQVKWVVDDNLPESKVLDTWRWYADHRGSSERVSMPEFCMMPEGCPPSSEHIQRAIDFARMAPSSYSWFVGPRLQYYYNMR